MRHPPRRRGSRCAAPGRTGDDAQHVGPKTGRRPRTDGADVIAGRIVGRGVVEPTLSSRYQRALSIRGAILAFAVGADSTLRAAWWTCAPVSGWPVATWTAGASESADLPARRKPRALRRTRARGGCRVAMAAAGCFPAPAVPLGRRAAGRAARRGGRDPTPDVGWHGAPPGCGAWAASAGNILQPMGGDVWAGRTGRRPGRRWPRAGQRARRRRRAGPGRRGG